MKEFLFALILVSTLGHRTSLHTGQDTNCFEYCENNSCDGDSTSYASCTACQSGSYGMDIGDGHVYCIDFCPSGFFQEPCTTPAYSTILESF